MVQSPEWVFKNSSAGTLQGWSIGFLQCSCVSHFGKGQTAGFSLLLPFLDVGRRSCKSAVLLSHWIFVSSRCPFEARCSQWELKDGDDRRHLPGAVQLRGFRSPSRRSRSRRWVGFFWTFLGKGSGGFLTNRKLIKRSVIHGMSRETTEKIRLSISPHGKVTHVFFCGQEYESIPIWLCRVQGWTPQNCGSSSRLPFKKV